MKISLYDINRKEPLHQGISSGISLQTDPDDGQVYLILKNDDGVMSSITLTDGLHDSVGELNTVISSDRLSTLLTPFKGSVTVKFTEE